MFSFLSRTFPRVLKQWINQEEAVNGPLQRRKPRTEKYLKEIDNYFIRRQTVKFRISDHSSMIEKGRHHGVLREDRICKQCDIGCVEDEFHFLLVCPK